MNYTAGVYKYSPGGSSRTVECFGQFECVVRECRAEILCGCSQVVGVQLVQAAAIARKACPTVPARIHCHMLRKTKAMDLYQHGIPLPIIMRLLGHENVSTTAAVYAFATIDMMRAAIDMMRAAIDAATPTPGDPAAHHLTEDALLAHYSLR